PPRAEDRKVADRDQDLVPWYTGSPSRRAEEAWNWKLPIRSHTARPRGVCPAPNDPVQPRGTGTQRTLSVRPRHALEAKFAARDASATSSARSPSYELRAAPAQEVR